jgi:diaminopimelate decarboxylase
LNLPEHLSVANRHLLLGGLDLVTLANTYGTPLYVTDEDRIISRFREYRDELGSRYGRVRVLYAAKANGNLAIMRALASEGAGADVFSSGELELALSAGMKPGDLLFNGSSKSPRDLALAVEKRVRISLDSTDELMQLEKVAAAAGAVVPVSFRINPALDVPTHPKIATGLATSKFGIPAARIGEAYREALGCEHVTPVGIHCHIGSQILDLEPFAQEARVLAAVAGDLTDMGVRLEFVDIGGGLGIPYHHDTDRAPSIAEYAAAVVPPLRKGLEEIGISPDLYVEPGRSLVADSTVLLTRVHSVKKAHKTFVNVDAGFNLLIRPVMYDSYHEVMVANRADEPPRGTCTITGPICETGDILAHDRELPAVVAGDLLAILDTGAYGFSMSSQYNSRPRCAEVLVKGGRSALMRRAETIGDLTATMVLPPWQA